MSGFANKVVLITGGSSGIGAEMARQLVGQGARVGVLARRANLLQELNVELGGGDNIAWAQADVRDPSQLTAALDQLATDLGPADIVVANAGVANTAPLDGRSLGAAEAMYETNLFGMLRLIDWALPEFLARGSGHIVGVSSLASYVGIPASASYSGSKAAMRVHLQALRVALKPKGIAVTTLCPGFIESPMTDDADFAMPFKLPVDEAVRRMLNAIEHEKGEYAFPVPMRLGIGNVARLPASATERVLGLGNR
jgi:NAD(P)-dependent dehydrogenase (short-subunit alcohol dehydrogenase family)